MTAPSIAVALDLGTSHLKCLAVSSNGAIIHQSQQATPYLAEPEVSVPAIDAELVRQWTERTLKRLNQKSMTVAFSSAMHSFLAIDQRQQLIDGAAYTWMDSRSAAQAWEKRQRVGLSWQQKTGTPLHAMSVVSKWLWWQRGHPDMRPLKIVGLKDWIIFGLTGRWMTDWTSASGTGFLALGSDTWDDLLLAEVGLESGQLPEIKSPAAALEWSCGRFVLGGGDAALAHFGLDVAADDGQGVLSLGTSGAIRTNLRQPPLPLAANFFCYRALAADEYLLGEAYSNIGSLLVFVADQCRVSVADLMERGLRRLQRGGRLPLFVPYVFGERSPYWEERLHWEWLEVDGTETSDDWMAAAVAAVVTILYGGSRHLKAAVPRLQRLRSGSRLLDHQDFAQVIANVTGLDLSVEEGLDASLLGAIRLASPRAWDQLVKGPKQRRSFSPQSRDLAFWQERWHKQVQATERQLDQLER